MSVLGKSFRPAIRKTRGSIVIRYICKCDECNLIFLRKKGPIISHKSGLTFCSSTCAYISKKLHSLITFNVRTLTNDPIRSKARLEKYKQTCIDRYGIENAMKSSKAIERFKQKLFKLYSDEEFRNTVKQRRKTTMLERYGVENGFQSNEIMKDINIHEINEKRHQTRKLHGTYGKSKKEDDFHKLLLTKFSNVKRQVDVNGWAIDFYIVNIDVYVQYDGAYYHGLDRPIFKIAEHRTKTDKVIHKTYKRDREQEQWFTENNMKLIRVIEGNEVKALAELVELSKGIYLN